MRSLVNFVVRVYRYRSLVVAMALRDVQTRYAGTLAGLVWTVVHPLLMILVYWFVFTKGLKVKPAGDKPFILIFLTGLVPWSMFAETISVSTNTIMGHSHLVKKTLFPTEILPVVCFLSSLMSHVVMLVILLVVMLVYGILPGVHSLQFVYFLGAMSVLCVGLGWAVSSLNVLCRDVGQGVTVVLSMWFWMTPVVWESSMLDKAHLWLVKLNPMFYVVEGYRCSFIGDQAFWLNWRQGIYFWVFATMVLFGGGALFRRLKGEFAEVV